MSNTQSLLIEIGTEELPIKALPELSQALFDGLCDGLEKAGVGFDRANSRALFTPRRLAVLLSGVAVEQAEQSNEVLGPYLNIALDANGQPTKALAGFAAKSGVEWNDLERLTDAKGERFVYRSIKPGIKTVELIGELLTQTVKALPIPKPMRWGNRETGFVRPVHWLVALFGEQVIACSLFGLKSGRTSRGHRFMHGTAVELARADDYIDALRQAKVLADPIERKARIRAQIEECAAENHLRARISEDNLDQVNALVEWPAPILCTFDAEFLRVPPEALIGTMEANQKFFPLLDAHGALSPAFIGVANLESKEPDQVRRGYERVIRPRFADAAFFYDEDLKQGLSVMNEGLAHVTYQAKLGSYAKKVARIEQLGGLIASDLNYPMDLTRCAALLCKADLQSRMVNEFPELQGLAGRYYAMQDIELSELGDDQRAQIAIALDEVYLPRHASDQIAASQLGRILAIAERIDTLAGGFIAGLKPTGNKDPFALRRNALALARTLIEAPIDLDLLALLRTAIAIYQAEGVSEANSVSAEDVLDFIYDRLRAYYQDRGVDAAQFDAVLSIRPCSLSDFDQRLRAINAFALLTESSALAAANKRIRNILKKNESTAVVVSSELLREPAEQALYQALHQAISESTDDLQARRYVEVLQRLSKLQPEVDAFFDQVMVMAEDPALRDNRLALLKDLADRFAAVAAIEQLSVA